MRARDGGPRSGLKRRPSCEHDVRARSGLGRPRCKHAGGARRFAERLREWTLRRGIRAGFPGAHRVVAVAPQCTLGSHHSVHVPGACGCWRALDSSILDEPGVATCRFSTPPMRNGAAGLLARSRHMLPTRVGTLSSCGERRQICRLAQSLSVSLSCAKRRALEPSIQRLGAARLCSHQQHSPQASLLRRKLMQRVDHAVSPAATAIYQTVLSIQQRSLHRSFGSTTPQRSSRFVTL